jgi:hypothetical protein
MSDVTAECIHCGWSHPNLENEQYQAGQIIMPYPGGGRYGYCLRCKKQGLRILTVPAAEVDQPEGWSKVPSV